MTNSLNEAIIINTQSNTNKIRIGNTVTLLSNEKEITFQILGSSESNPNKNIISHNSPLGTALLGKSVKNEIKLTIDENTFKYKILNIK